MLWGSNLQQQRTEDSRRNPWHGEYLENGREQVESNEDSGSSSPDGIDRNAGTWGERDAGRLNTRTAAQDMNVLREELATLSRTRSQGAQSDRNDGTGLFKTISRKSTRQSTPREQATGQNAQRRSSVTRTEDGTGDKSDEEPGDIGAAAAQEKEEDDFELGEFMKEGHFEKREDGQSAKKVGVVYKNLTVKGVGSTASFARTLPDAVLGTFGPDLYKLVSGWIPALRIGKHKQTRTLIHDFSGVVKE